MLIGMDQGGLRAGDADRERVAERLRVALEEGRLNLHEYDERLRDAFSAKTYAELDALLTDLPGVVPTSHSQVVPASSGVPVPPQSAWQSGADGRYPNATARWVVEHWGSYFRAVSICVGIWAVL